MNASARPQQVQAHGAWFAFAPEQIKEMNDDKVAFLTSVKAYLGFVSVPETLADLDFRQSKEGKELMVEVKKSGIANRIKHLEWLKHNELKSLRVDMDKANIKADISSEMTGESSKALAEALKELKEYSVKKINEVQKTMDEINELAKELE